MQRVIIARTRIIINKVGFKNSERLVPLMKFTDEDSINAVCHAANLKEVNIDRKVECGEKSLPC